MEPLCGGTRRCEEERGDQPFFWRTSIPWSFRGILICFFGILTQAPASNSAEKGGNDFRDFFSNQTGKRLCRQFELSAVVHRVRASGGCMPRDPSDSKGTEPQCTGPVFIVVFIAKAPCAEGHMAKVRYRLASTSGSISRSSICRCNSLGEAEGGLQHHTTSNGDSRAYKLSKPIANRRSMVL
jgi:hypothetical protein